MKVAELQIRAGMFPQGPGKVNQTGKEFQNNTSGIKEGTNFADILGKRIEESNLVSFSAHAVKRLEERALQISPNEIERLNDGVKQLDAKGSKNSLVMVDDTAFVVSIRNKTVITAIDKNLAGNNLFTNIDSVAFV